MPLSFWWLAASTVHALSITLIAAVYIGLGETDRAFSWLHQACEERATALVNVKVEPAFDGLRGDPRFADLLRCVGLS